MWTAEFATFIALNASIATGIALTTIGGEHDHRFIVGWDRLACDRRLLEEYNALKLNALALGPLLGPSAAHSPRYPVRRRWCRLGQGPLARPFVAGPARAALTLHSDTRDGSRAPSGASTAFSNPQAARMERLWSPAGARAIKEGVDGSSPSEGSRFPPAQALFPLS